MLQRGYNRAPRRQLIPNLFSNILKVIADADHPLTHHEIVEAVSERMDRSDEELRRQITVSLQDALIYGYLRVKNFRYSIVENRLDPNEPRDFSQFNKTPMLAGLKKASPNLGKNQREDNEQSTSKDAANGSQARTPEGDQGNSQELPSSSLGQESIQPSVTQRGTETDEETNVIRTNLSPHRRQREME